MFDTGRKTYHESFLGICSLFCRGRSSSMVVVEFIFNVCRRVNCAPLLTPPPPHAVQHFINHHIIKTNICHLSLNLSNTLTDSIHVVVSEVHNVFHLPLTFIILLCRTFIIFFSCIIISYHLFPIISSSLNSILLHHFCWQAQVRKATAGRGGAGGGAAGNRAGAGSSNILQFYTDDSPGLQVGPTTVLVASLSFVGLVVLLHIWGKFRM